jgi:hypothetical protein
MDFKFVNRIAAAFVFLFATIIYFITVQPTFSFWDCGEFIVAAYTLSIPHPPGAPFFILVGKFFTMLPLAEDIGLRVNYLSAISSSITVMLLYLIITKIIKNWRGYPESTFNILLIVGASIVGALSYAFSETFWFSALEAEVYGLGTLLIGLSIYILMLWWEKADDPGSDKYLLIVAYIVGLSIGLHLLVVQCIFLAGLFFYFRRYNYSQKTLLIAIGLSAIGFFVVYPGIVKKYPEILMNFGLFAGILIVGVIVFGIYYANKNKNSALKLIFTSLFLIFIGYSTYISVIMRADVPNLPINENAPADLETLISYLNREQYGQQPLVLPRRHSQDPMHQRTWANYSSDMDFLWKYQINHMFNRYWFWNYIGREGHNQNDGVDFSKFYAIPFLIGMLGIFYHFRRDWKMAFIFLMMFLMLGVITALYQNQQDPQPRERDYFYVGAFMTFSIWIGVGVAGLIEQVTEKIKNRKSLLPAGAVIVAVAFLLIPMNMLRVNYPYLSRADNYFPFDYAYNLLQSTGQDAILITNGDNDTFPLWCLQAVYGIRTDVRVVNLSLAQTDWYNLQLKNETPYGAKTVPMNLTDAQLRKLSPVQWEENKTVTFDVPVSAYPDSMQTNPDLPDKITISVPPTIRQQSGNQVITAVKANDLLLIDIIKANNWERPIYFSVTVSEDYYIGLSEYLVLEGMAQRVVPFKTAGDPAVAINQEVMRESLFNKPTEPSATPEYGFLLRNLDDPGIFFNEDQERMIQTFRTLYLRLAYSYSSDSAKFALANETLDIMEQRIPKEVIPMDYRIQYDIAILYDRIGNVEKFREYAADVESRALDELSSNPMNFQSYYNPYRILMDIYEAKGEYNKAMDVLNRLAQVTPNDPSIQQKRALLQEKINEN